MKKIIAILLLIAAITFMFIAGTSSISSGISRQAQPDEIEEPFGPSPEPSLP